MNDKDVENQQDISPVSPVSPGSNARARARGRRKGEGQGQRRKDKPKGLGELCLDLWGRTWAGRIWEEPDRTALGERVREAMREARKLKDQATRKLPALDRSADRLLWNKILRDCLRRHVGGAATAFPVPGFSTSGSPYAHGGPAAGAYRAVDDPHPCAFIFLEVELLLGGSPEYLAFAWHYYVEGKSLEDFGEKDQIGRYHRQRLRLDLAEAVDARVAHMHITKTMVAKYTKEIIDTMRKERARQKAIATAAEILAPQFRTGFKPAPPPEATTKKELLAWYAYEHWRQAGGESIGPEPENGPRF